MKLTPHRKTTESFKKYVKRRAAENKMVKDHLQGRYFKVMPGRNRKQRQIEFAKLGRKPDSIKPHEIGKSESANRGHIMYSRLMERVGLRLQ